jgi:hypothetical protein
MLPFFTPLLLLDDAIPAPAFAFFFAAFDDLVAFAMVIG